MREGGNGGRDLSLHLNDEGGVGVGWMGGWAMLAVLSLHLKDEGWEWGEGEGAVVAQSSRYT